MITKPDKFEDSCVLSVTEGSGTIGTSAAYSSRRLDTSEKIVIDPVTGGAKASKLARFDLLPAGPLWQLAEHYGKGTAKYSDRNWERGYKWSLSFAAMMRHAWAFWRGETYDDHRASCVSGCTEHTGSHHMVCAAWHALALVEFTQSHPQGDDRPKPQQATAQVAP